jgi:hypothetical protein
MLSEVPYDPLLPQLFFGEEISMAARLHTHGFELFAPPEAVVYHLWTRDHRPTFSTAQDNAQNVIAAQHQDQVLSDDDISSIDGAHENAFSHTPTNVCRMEKAKKAEKEQSLTRIRTLLSIQKDKGPYQSTDITENCQHVDCQMQFGKYGLGSARSLGSFEDRVGVSLSTQTLCAAHNANDSLLSRFKDHIQVAFVPLDVEFSADFFQTLSEMSVVADAKNDDGPHTSTTQDARLPPASQNSKASALMLVRDFMQKNLST